MMSGMRNEPPISTSSPRDTSASRRLASVFNVNNTAAALLLTTVAASAPVSSHRSSAMRASRSPRAPESRSNSRLTGAVSAATTARTASAGSTARPRLVCSTVPVRLNTGRRRNRSLALSFVSKAGAIASSVSAERPSVPARAARRSSSRYARSTEVTCARPWRATRGASAGRCSSRSTDGISAALASGTSIEI